MGIILEAANIGTTIKRLRKMSGLSQRDLAHDICSQAQISKLEQNNEIPSALTLFKIAQRLGVDMNYFFDVQETPRLDYVNDTKEMVRQLIRERNYSKIKEILNGEKRNPLFQENKNKQFILWHEAICIHYLDNKSEESIDLLHKALSLTYSNNKRYYSENEIEILNSIAIIQKDMELYEYAESNFKEGLRGLKLTTYKGNHQIKVRLLYGLSKLLTDLGRYLESLDYCKEGIQICKKHEMLYLLGELYYQYGENCAMLGDFHNAEISFDKSIRTFDIQDNHEFIRLVKQLRDDLLGEKNLQ